MDRLPLVLALLLASATALAQPSLHDQALRAERAGDAKAAVNLYAQAARKGDGQAAYRLGEIYQRGLGGVAPDASESQRWFNAARTLGYPPLIGDFPPRRR